MDSILQHILPLLIFCSSCCGQLHQIDERNEHYQKKEGEDLALKYIFNQTGEDCTYHLTYNSETFHARGLSKSSGNYHLNKHTRSHVQREELFGYAVISLTIWDINFEDRGEYSCMLTCGESNYLKTFDITVYKPPGLASCHWQNTSSVDLEESFSVLTCHANNGHPHASIVCYTVEGNAPVAHTPFHVHGDQLVKGKFWLNRNADVKCCSVSREFRKHYETCNDFSSAQYSYPLLGDIATAGLFLPVIANESQVPRQATELHTATSSLNKAENIWTIVLTVTIIFTFTCIFVGTIAAFHFQLKKVRRAQKGQLQSSEKLRYLENTI